MKRYEWNENGEKRNENRNGRDERVSVNKEQGIIERVRMRSQKRNWK